MNETLNAEQARALTSKALGPDSQIIAPYMANIAQRICEEATKGRSELVHPFSKIKGMDYPSNDIEKAIRKALESQGFIWTDHADPDPGHPGSGPYSTVSWQ